MSEPRDDELRAMLEARADRMPASAGAEILAAVRDELGAARGGARFAIQPVTTCGRGAKAPAGWAAVALVAALVLVVTGGRLDLGTTKPAATGEPSASSGAVIPSGTAASAASPTAATSTPPAVTPRTMTAAALQSALADGSLDGRLVLVQGRLRVVAVPCPYPVPPGCFGITVPELEGVSMTWDVPLTRQVVETMQGTLAFVVRGSALGFEGRVARDPAQPLTLQELIDRAGLLTAAAQFELTSVGGWLVVGGIHSCPALGPGATPCPGPPPGLTDKQPFPEGMMASDLVVPVAVGASVPGVQPGRIVTPGPFLVRMVHAPGCTDLDNVNETACLSVKPASMHLIARYDPANVVQVVTAPITCDQPPGGSSAGLTCDAAVAAAIAAVPPDASITSIELHYGWYCPPDAYCPFIPALSTVGYVIVHIGSPDSLIVGVRLTDVGGVVATDVGPYPPR